jgi:hypothetical protein
LGGFLACRYPHPVGFSASYFLWVKFSPSGRVVDYAFQQQFVEKRDYETLDLYVLNLLMGIV